MGKPVTTVALGFEDVTLSEEILSLFDRDPAFRVVGAAGDEGALSRLTRDAHPAAIVGSPTVLSRVESNGALRLAVAERESVALLRDAIHAGAAGFYLWPQDRARLTGDAARLVRLREDAPRPRGRVVAVCGARGGAGATFVATHLAAATARLGVSTCILECDPFFADVAAALGIAGDESVRTIEDLVPVLDEVSSEHVDDVLHRHAAGFSVLAGPRDVAVAEALRTEHVEALADALSRAFELVILHGSRCAEPLTRAALEAADRILLVMTLDVLALRDARRALSFLEGAGLGERCELVVNRAARSDVVPADVERVLGLPVRAIIRADRRVPRAMDRGELVSGRGKGPSRPFVRLARRLTEVSA